MGSSFTPLDQLISLVEQETTVCPDCEAVEDVGLSDHHLLRWEVSPTRRPSLVSVLVRGAIWTWSFLDLLCLLRGYVIQTTGRQTSMRWHDIELIGVLDRLVAERDVTRRPRLSDPWFEGASAAASRHAATTNASHSSTGRDAELLLLRRRRGRCRCESVFGMISEALIANFVDKNAPNSRPAD